MILITPTTHSTFVYGTLKPGGHYWPDFCEGKVAEPIPAKIEGELYDLNVGYPGLRLARGKWVQGYILTFSSEADFLRVDELEGYAPTGPNRKMSTTASRSRPSRRMDAFSASSGPTR